MPVTILNTASVQMIISWKCQLWQVKWYLKTFTLLKFEDGSLFCTSSSYCKFSNWRLLTCLIFFYKWVLLRGRVLTYILTSRSDENVIKTLCSKTISNSFVEKKQIFCFVFSQLKCKCRISVFFVITKKDLY